MKLAKKLFSSGVLGRGVVRHCSEWDLPSGLLSPRFRSAHPLREIDLRRSRQGSFRGRVENSAMKELSGAAAGGRGGYCGTPEGAGCRRAR